MLHAMRSIICAYGVWLVAWYFSCVLCLLPVVVFVVCCFVVFFFFQAEDGIRDWSVTGVQTCALPISRLAHRPGVRWSVAAFQRAPFWTTAIVILSPIPDSAVRVLAPLARYPLPKFLGAVTLGRFPRLLLIAGVGGLVPVPTWGLLGGGVALVGLAAGRHHVASAFRWLRVRYRDLYAVSVAGFRL